VSRFFTSWGILIAAWLIVLAAFGGGLTLALMQPPPEPPSAAALTAVEGVDDEAPATSLAGAEGTAAESPEPQAESPVAAPEAPAPAENTAPDTLPAPQAGETETTATESPAPADSQPSPPHAEPTTAPETPPAAEPDPQQAAIPLIPPAPEELAYWERYRQPFNMADQRPRIAVVLSGLGLSDSATEAAINKLPAAVTLSFSPYARDLERWIALARARGHEVMLDLPMEPTTFPTEDPGPQGLLTHLTAEDNLDRLDWVLSRGSAYVGLAGVMGSRFTASRSDMEPILKDIKQRGLIYLDRRTTENSVVPEVAREIGLPAAVNNRSVDERQASRVAIDARLAQIERIALSDGSAVAMAQPYPVTIDRLADWATELTARGFVMAPISALAARQTQP
jgi:polysaccharide deacetylase 2 family uncharacterized protein YibQ